MIYPFPSKIRCITLPKNIQWRIERVPNGLSSYASRQFRYHWPQLSKERGKHNKRKLSKSFQIDERHCSSDLNATHKAKQFKETHSSCTYIHTKETINVCRPTECSIEIACHLQMSQTTQSKLAYIPKSHLTASNRVCLTASMPPYYPKVYTMWLL